MGQLKKDTFICLDCESTGLDEKNDRIIEIAAVKFTFQSVMDTKETLIDPKQPIPESSQEIHNISNEMVQGKPGIESVLPEFLSFIKGHIIVGHKIDFDLSLIHYEALRANVPCSILETKTIDTLRLARLYGQSPTNSLESLRAHFNIPQEGPHRAMSDVIINIEVFKHLTTSFKTTEAILERLKKPVLLRAMPLGKHKGRPFKEIPIEYLSWAVRQNFDDDLLFSIKKELKGRRKQPSFQQASNPFSSL